MLPNTAPNHLRLLEYWTSVEYLQPQELPKAADDKLTWWVGNDDEFPWRHAERRRRVFASAGMAAAAARSKDKLPRDFEARVFVGVIDKKALSGDLRALFPNDGGESALRDPTGWVAVMMVSVNHSGHLIGKPQISSVPWAMGRLHRQNGGQLSGFEGADGFENATIEKLAEHFAPYTTPEEPQEDQEALGAKADEDATHEPKQTKPIDSKALFAGLEQLLRECGWGHSLVERKMVVSVSKISTKAQNQSVDLLNSFYTDELQRVAGETTGRRALPKVLRTYLGAEADHVDVRQVPEVLQEAVLPNRLPLGAWPSKFPLARAQQFAVNQIMAELGDANARGIYAVNGPPGTGKTTLLKDVIAAIIVKRAEALAAREAAPSLTVLRDDVAVDGMTNPRKLWAFDSDAILGHSIVVASGNNGAVENISKDLPVSKSIYNGDIGELSYFREIAERVFAQEDGDKAPGDVWGLISAALGNSKNRRSFTDRFWFGEDKKGRGDDQKASDPGAAALTMRDLLRADRPANVLNWQEARKQFVSARDKVHERIAYLDKLAREYRHRDENAKREIDLTESIKRDERRKQDTEVILQGLLEERKKNAERLTKFNRLKPGLEDLAKRATRVVTVASNYDVMLAPISRASFPSAIASMQRLHAEAEAAAAEARDQHVQVLKRKPGLISRVLQPRAHRAWSSECERLIARVQSSDQASRAAVKLAKDLDEIHREMVAFNLPHAEPVARVADAVVREIGKASERVKQLDPQIKRRESDLAAILSILGVNKDELTRIREAREWLHEQLSGIDAASLKALVAALGNPGSPDAERAAPWADRELQALRARCFAAAMNLHAAFIFERRSEFRSNLQLWINILQGNIRTPLTERERRQLWETFFLVVPVVSTTFASLGRMFSRLGEEGIGWLFVDEAGQATPQMAVGALWRSKRAVIVGDPLQLEPVLTMTDDILIRLARQHGLATQWANRSLSVQNLGDRASVYGTYLAESKGDPTWVGSPLIVHRRCLEPMFGVANRAAYDSMMVYGTPATGGQHSMLPPSCWIDIPSVECKRNAVPRQTAAAAVLARTLLASLGGVKTSDGRDTLYVLSPFKDAVADCRERFGSAQGMDDCLGTIHTFQGREAEVVILVLGADRERPGAITGFAAAKPNLLNVAVTRARSRLYVIGDRPLWVKAPYFEQLSVLPIANVEDLSEQVRTCVAPKVH